MSHEQAVGFSSIASHPCKERKDGAPGHLFSGSENMDRSLRASVVLALRTEREGRGTPFTANAGELKSLGDPPCGAKCKAGPAPRLLGVLRLGFLLSQLVLLHCEFVYDRSSHRANLNVPIAICP